MTLTLGGNAAALLRAGETTVVIDPWLGERIGPWRRLRPCALRPDAVAAPSALLITHAHPDHLDRATLARIEKDTPAATPGGTPARLLRGLGFSAARPLAEWERWELPEQGLAVTAVPAIHVRWSLGYVVELGGVRIYHAGDANPRTPFAEIGRRCGPLDAALVPVGGSSLAPGPLQRHLTPLLAARATAALNPRLAIPIHWGHVPCVPAAIDRFRGTAAQYAEAMRKVAPAIPVLVPAEGESVVIPGG